MDWIEHEQRLISISQNCLREPITSLNVNYMYIDKNNAMESFILDKINFAYDEPRTIPNKKIIQMIQSHKKENTMSHYVLKDCFLFHIDIEPELIADFHEDHHKQYMKHIPIVDDICLNDSIFVFHPYSTLYFIYYEEDKMAVKALKSALKSGTHNTRITKRVHWNDKKKRNTRKHVVS